MALRNAAHFVIFAGTIPVVTHQIGMVATQSCTRGTDVLAARHSRIATHVSVIDIAKVPCTINFR